MTVACTLVPCFTGQPRCSEPFVSRPLGIQTTIKDAEFPSAVSSICHSSALCFGFWNAFGGQMSGPINKDWNTFSMTRHSGTSGTHGVEQTKCFTNSSPEQRQNPCNAKSNIEVRVFQAIPMLGSVTAEVMVAFNLCGRNLQLEQPPYGGVKGPPRLFKLKPHCGGFPLRILYRILCVVRNIRGYPRINIGNDMETIQIGPSGE